MKAHIKLKQGYSFQPTAPARPYRYPTCCGGCVFATPNGSSCGRAAPCCSWQSGKSIPIAYHFEYKEKK